MKSTLKTDLNKYANGLENAPMIDDSHFCDFHNNIFEGKMSEEFVKMFMEGDGSELVSKACAVHSSSMLGYNFFHWISDINPLKIKFDIDKKEVSYTNVYFEVKMRVLKGRSRPANMDIVLTNKNGDILFIESKFLEYLKFDTFSISETYKKEESYFCFGEKWTKLIGTIKADLKKQYYGGIKQEITHMIALNNWVKGEIDILLPDNENKVIHYNENKDIRFINLVFKPNEKYAEEFDAYSNYVELYDGLHKKLKESNLISGELKMFFMSYSDLWPDVKKCISDELKQYLEKHYMNFAYKKP